MGFRFPAWNDAQRVSVELVSGQAVRDTKGNLQI